MGECLITRRGGVSYELPVLDENYPQDVSLIVIKGNTVSATFNAVFTTHGKPAEYTYQWYVDGVAVEGTNSAVFTMADLGETVNHSVYCEITNKAGTVTTRVATLKVTQYYTPVLNASYPADVTLNDGSTTSATFKVQIDTAGNPASYTYQWYVDGAAVPAATNATYTMSGLTTAATHTVYCKVTNAAGTVQSRTATLSVKHTLLYNAGNQYTSVTGGWAAYAYKISPSGSTAQKPELTVGSNNLKIGFAKNSADPSYRAGSLFVENEMDVTNFSELEINVSEYSADCGVSVGLTKTKANNFVSAASTGISSTGTKTVDVSNLSGKYYIYLEMSGAIRANAHSVAFTKAYLK